MSNPRNEQFAKWAKAVIMRMLEHRKGGWIDFNVDDPEAIAEYSAILARAGYDLVKHAALETHPLASMSEIDTIVERVPDMAELPEEQER